MEWVRLHSGPDVCLCEIFGQVEVRFRSWNGGKAGKVCLSCTLLYFIEIAGEKTVGVQGRVRIDGADQLYRENQPDTPGSFVYLRMADKFFEELFGQGRAVLAFASIAGQHGAVCVNLEVKIARFLLPGSKTEKGFHSRVKVNGIVILQVGTAGVFLLALHFEDKRGFWKIAKTTGGERAVTSSPVKLVYLKN